MSSRARVRTAVVRGAAATRAEGAIGTGSIAAFDPTKKLPTNPLEAAEVARLAAMEQGYNDGLAAARTEIELAMEDSNKRVRRALAALSEAVVGFDQRQTVALGDVEHSIVNAAFSIARSILQREITVAADPGAEAIARALELAPGREAAIVRINPDDAATLNLTDVQTMGRPIELVADPAIELGGCMVEIGDTTIDAQISSALAKVADTLVIPNDHGALMADVASERQKHTVSEPQVRAEPQKKAAPKKSAVAGRNPKKSRKTGSESPRR